MLEKSDKQTIKDALAASAKAISEDTELNVNFGIENLRQSSLPEPLQPVKNFNDLRAKSDQVALINKYSSDNRIKVIKNTQKIGMIDNFNLVLNKSTSDYFIWIGAHDLYLPNFLEKLVENIEKNKNFFHSL